jgi:hypothetical protein
MPTIISETTDEQKKFKAKIVLGTKRVSKWERKTFKIPGRTNGASFSHWWPAKRLEEVHKFSKFNRKLSIPKYTDAEYQQHFASEQWTKEETEYLFDMCNDWDLRFIVMADRWNPPEGSVKRDRTVEEIKDRYYSIQRTLLTVRRNTSEEDLASNPLLQHPYDPVRETERKRQQNQQTHRTPDEIALENEITSECARIDSTFKKHSEDALKYLRLIKKQQKYYANLKIERAAYQATKDLDERNKNSKRGQTGTAASSTSAMNVDAPESSSAPVMPSPAPTPIVMPTKLTRRHPAAFSRTHAKTYTATLVPLLNQQKYAPLFAKALPELGMDNIPRTSFILIAAVTELRCDLLLLHEMQKLHAEKSYELEVLKTLQKTLQDRLKAMPPVSAATSSATPQVATSSAPIKAPAPATSSTSMDVDQS